MSTTVVTALPSPAPPAAEDDGGQHPSPPQPAKRRIPPPCWAPDEVLALLDAYRDKCTDLGRPNLRAPHWQDIAAALAAARPSPVPKTPLQCRHKIEKLRKRYRSELRRAGPSSWPFSPFFAALDPEPLPPATVARPPPPPPSPSDSSGDNGKSNTRSLHRLMSNGVGVRFRLPKPKLPPATAKRGRVSPVGEVAAAIRRLADDFVRVEEMKVVAARESERLRMEMEAKRLKMILDSHEQIIGFFARSFPSSKTLTLGSGKESDKNL